jgi:uroporphyrinogen III methyltransferase/synthase
VIPRALVVRSGAIPGMAFPRPNDPGRLEVVEIVSHAVFALEPALEPLVQPARLAIFTSQIAVALLLEDPARANLFRTSLVGGQVAAIGDSTAEALRSRGIPPDIVAAGSGASLIDLLPARLDGWRVLLPRGEDATDELPEELGHRGARLAPFVMYRKNPVPRDPDLDRDLVLHPFSAFCTTSPSAAKWLFAGATESSAARLRETPAVVLGRFTARYLESHGVARVELAPEASFVSALALLETLAAAPPPA